MIRRMMILVALVAAICMSADAQVMHVLDITTTGEAQDVYLPSASYPAGGGSYFGVELLPVSGALAIGPRSGGMTIDQKKSIVYSSDGFLITFDNNPLYLPFSPAAVLPSPVAAPLLLTTGPITGMALDTLGGILWMTDGLSLRGFTPVPPFLPVTPIFPITFTFSSNFLTGLDFDSATGTLWGCDLFGGIYNFTTTAVPLGAQPVSIVTLHSSSAGMGGLCVNRTNGFGSTGVSFCSTQSPDYHICVTDGPRIYDALVSTNPIILNASSSGAPARGLAMSCDNQIIPGAVGCPFTFTFPLIGMNKATHNGAGGGNAFRLVDGPISTTALLLYDFCPIPGGLFVFASGETLWINTLSSTFGFAGFTTNTCGEVTVPISFSFATAGLQYSMQWAISDPLAPLGYCLSDGMTFTAGVQ